MPKHILMVIFLFLMSEDAKSESETTCAKLRCLSEPNEYCLTFANDTYTHWRCPRGLHCPELSLSALSPTRCTTEAPPLKPELACFNYGEVSERCSDSLDIFDSFAAQPCNANAFCDSELHICLPRVQGNSPCKAGDLCVTGYVCSLNKCVEYSSVETGHNATDSFACQSGILFANNTCAPPSLTLVSLPQKCKMHSECTASDGQPGQCLCAFDAEGSSFCKLHKSDPPVLEWRKALIEGNLERAYAILLSLKVYPSLYSIPRCFWSELIEFKEFVKGQERMIECQRLKDTGITSYPF